MKIFTKVSVAIVVVSVALGLTGPIAALAAGPAPVDLLGAGNFTILSKTGITNTGSHTSLITGNIGASPITAAAMNNVFCSEIIGTIYGVDAAYVGSGATTCFAGNPPLSNKTLVDNAVADMGTAYADAAGRTLPDTTELGAGDISGLTITPGLHKWSTDVAINSNVTLSGGPNDVWIFQIEGNLNVASGGSVPAGVKVVLSGGAQASNVFWQVGGGTGATLGTYSTFNGTILSAKQVIMQTGAVLNGRALADTQVTLDANPVSSPATAATCEDQTTQDIVSDTTTQVDGHDAVVVTPHPSWATIAGASWIWNESTDGAGSHPVGTKTFTKTFTIAGTPLDSSLQLSADNGYTVHVNGIPAGADADEGNWSSIDTIAISASALHTGLNTITFTVDNYAPPAGYTGPNPGGLIYKLTVNECGVPSSPPPPPANACFLPSVPGYTLQNGTPGNDIVTLAPFTMFIGNGGNDIVTAGKGNFIVCTLGGNDIILLGAGTSTIDARGGTNTVTTGHGTGFIRTGAGTDTITTGSGAHTISGGDGKNTITTGSGDQTITTGSGNDTIVTSTGNDTIHAGSGKNKVLAGGGTDSLTALGGNDFFDGGAGTDTCSAGGGTNTVVNCEL